MAIKRNPRWMPEIKDGYQISSRLDLEMVYHIAEKIKLKSICSGWLGLKCLVWEEQ